MTPKKKVLIWFTVFLVCEWQKIFKFTGQARVIERNYCYVWVLMVVVAWCRNGAETIYSHKVHGWVSWSEVSCSSFKAYLQGSWEVPISEIHCHAIFPYFIRHSCRGQVWELRMGEKGGPVVGPWNFYWDSCPDFLWESFVVCFFTKHLVWIFFRGGGDENEFWFHPSVFTSPVFFEGDVEGG